MTQSQCHKWTEYLSCQIQQRFEFDSQLAADISKWWLAGIGEEEQLPPKEPGIRARTGISA